jgi:hypothetical protein
MPTTGLPWEGPTPWRFKGFNEALNGQASDDYWRAFEQTSSGRYYLGSEVSGQRVLQLVYEPTVTPSMLLVLTDLGLTVLRGP